MKANLLAELISLVWNLFILILFLVGLGRLGEIRDHAKAIRKHLEGRP